MRSVSSGDSEGDNKDQVAATLIDELLEAGTPVDEGGFTLDATAAAAKMSAFRYADTNWFLIPLVEALHMLDCREIAIEMEGEDLSIRALNVTLTEPQELFNQLYAHAFGDNKDRALGRLAVAVDMILADPQTKHVTLSYSSNSREHVAVYRQRRAPELSEADPGVIRELRVFVERALINSRDAQLDSLAHLRAAVRHSPRSISLEGEIISQHERAWSEVIEGEGEGCRFRVGLSEDRASSVELWANDLCVDRLDLPGLEAVIELAAPRRDLSQMKVVRNADLERAVAAVEQARVELLGPDAQGAEPSDASAGSTPKDPLATLFLSGIALIPWFVGAGGAYLVLSFMLRAILGLRAADPQPTLHMKEVFILIGISALSLLWATLWIWASGLLFTDIVMRTITDKDEKKTKLRWFVGLSLALTLVWTVVNPVRW